MLTSCSYAVSSNEVILSTIYLRQKKLKNKAVLVSYYEKVHFSWLCYLNIFCMCYTLHVSSFMEQNKFHRTVYKWAF